MPVTIYPAPHSAELIHRSYYDEKQGTDQGSAVLHYACSQKEHISLELLRSSFDSKSTSEGDQLLPTPNGLVNAAIKAYSHHHHLVIRPDDVWITILIQLGFYINAHAEELRDVFVSHQGQEELVVEFGDGTLSTVDYSVFATEMSKLVKKKVVDPELCSWMLPAFSTTTQHDVAIASVAMMGSMQKYFRWVCRIKCGLPSVTLLGKRQDYELILDRLDKLCDFGLEPTLFRSLLRPVLRRFSHSFDKPKDRELIDFWQRIFKKASGGSGPAWYSGWITAFTLWNEEGKLLKRFQAGDKNPSWGGFDTFGEQLLMDGVSYGTISEEDVPTGLIRTPIKIIDRGEEFEAEMIAGSAGIKCTSTGGRADYGPIGLDTVQAQTGWWVYGKVNKVSTKKGGNGMRIADRTDCN